MKSKKGNFSQRVITKYNEVGIINAQIAIANVIGLNSSKAKLSLLIRVPIQKRPVKRQILLMNFKYSTITSLG